MAFASCILHHVEAHERGRVVAEMARVVAPGGLVAVLEHNPANPLTRFVVSRCAFDEGVELLGPEFHEESAGERRRRSRSRAAYIVFFPWRGRLFRRIEARLGSVPLGAQYAVAGRRR